MITEIKNVIFEKYQVRKGKKKKTAFIEYIESVCAENNIPVTVEKKEMNRNIVMGAKPEDAEMVLGAHYDTCAVMFMPNFLTPKNILIYVLYQIILCIALFIPGVLLSALAAWLGYVAIAPMVFGVCCLAACVLLMAGPANKHTANDNTSGVITVLNIMLSMTPEQREKVCFVLFDNEELGLLGSSAFASMHKSAMKNKPLINFDCVSDGDHLFVKLPRKDKKSDFGMAVTKAFGEAADETGMNAEIGVNGLYPSDQSNFKRGIAVAAFRKSRLCGLYLARIHTHKDTVFNERNIECITSGMLRLMEDTAAE